MNVTTSICRHVFLPLLVASAIAFGIPAFAEPIVFQSTDTPPYWSAQFPDNGFGGSVLKLLSDVAVVPYSINYLPVKRFRNSEATYLVGDPDILINNRSRAIFPIGIFRSAFFYYKPHHDVIEYHSIRDLRGHTLGVIRGTIEGKEDFVRNGINVEESDSVESLIRKLKRGRIDFCITVSDTARYKIMQLYPEQQNDFIMVDIPALDRPFAIMIDMENTEGKAVARQYQQILEKTLQSHEYHNLMDRYYGASSSDEINAKLDQFIQYYANTWGN